MLRTTKITIEPDGEVKITEMSGQCWADMMDGREAGMKDVEVAALVTKHSFCPDKTIEEVLRDYSPNTLTTIMIEVTKLSDLGPKNSDAGRDASLSSA